MFLFRNSRATILTERLNHLISCFTDVYNWKSPISSNMDENQFSRASRAEKGIQNKRKRESNLVLMLFDVNVCVRVYQVYLDNATFICHIKSLDANAVVFVQCVNTQIRNFRFSVLFANVCPHTERIDLGIQHITCVRECNAKKWKKKNQNLTTDTMKILKMIKKVPSTPSLYNSRSLALLTVQRILSQDVSWPEMVFSTFVVRLLCDCFKFETVTKAESAILELFFKLFNVTER